MDKDYAAILIIALGAIAFFIFAIVSYDTKNGGGFPACRPSVALHTSTGASVP